MKFQTLLLTVAPALVAAAPAAAAGTCDSGSGSPSPSPSPSPAPVGTNPFGVVAMHSGNAVQYAPFNAAKSSLLAGLKHQNASCDRPGEQTATFYLDDGALFLYDASATPQEIFVDRSGMGQGVIGYTTGAEPAPTNSERKGWAITSDNHLQFAGQDLIACPGSLEEGAFSIWADAGVANPGYNQGCVGIAARVQVAQNPNGCLYTSQ